MVATFVAAAVFLTGFIAWERVAAHPMLPLRFFADRRFSVGSAVVTVSFFVMFGFFFLFSLYLQLVRGYSPLDAGLATLPMAATFIVVSPRSAPLAERIGNGRTIALGLFIVGLGMGVFSRVGTDTPYVVLALALCSSPPAWRSARAPRPGASRAPSRWPRPVLVGHERHDREVGGALGIAVFGSIGTRCTASTSTSVGSTAVPWPPRRSRTRWAAPERAVSQTGVDGGAASSSSCQRVHPRLRPDGDHLRHHRRCGSRDRPADLHHGQGAGCRSGQHRGRRRRGGLRTERVGRRSRGRLRP